MNVETANIVWTDPAVRSDRCKFSRHHGADSDIDRLIELAQVSEKDRVLDLVTGLGFVAMAFAPTAGAVDAVDPDEEVLAEAKKTAETSGLKNINFLAGDPTSIPAKDDTYNVVAARGALHHTSEAAKSLKEIHRVLKPDGRLLLIDSLRPLQPDLANFIENLEKRRDRSHLRSYDLEEWESLLDHEGFDINLMEIFPREYNFDVWTRLSDNNQDVVRMLAMMLHGASPRAKRHFRILEEAKTPVSFVTWMILIRACPRG
jgi:ubiquinone/menaquinone biosynthesis C-methylase UbiE